MFRIAGRSNRPRLTTFSFSAHHSSRHRTIHTRSRPWCQPTSTRGPVIDLKCIYHGGHAPRQTNDRVRTPHHLASQPLRMSNTQTRNVQCDTLPSTAVFHVYDDSLDIESESPRNRVVRIHTYAPNYVQSNMSPTMIFIIHLQPHHVSPHPVPHLHVTRQRIPLATQ